MRTSHALLAALFLLPAACKGEPEQSEPADIMVAIPQMILPPNATFVSRAGSQDAAEVTFSTPVPVGAVADFYRGQLSRQGWRLESDTKDSAGTVMLYAEGATRPMWVSVRAVDSLTHVTITGAVPGMDTTFARKQADTRDTTNTLTPR